MTKDEVFLALRMVAMGRMGHDAVTALVEHLADKEPVVIEIPVTEADTKKRKKAE